MSFSKTIAVPTVSLNVTLNVTYVICLSELLAFGNLNLDWLSNLHLLPVFEVSYPTAFVVNPSDFMNKGKPVFAVQI